MSDLTLSGLVSSRICHDLISPVGAIGNGMELLQAEAGASAAAGGEEIRLIAECAEAAAGTLQFLRLAFGARRDEERVAVSELAAAAAGYLSARRIALDWGAAGGDLSFRAGRALLLMSLAAAAALPRGGSLDLAAASEAPLSLAWRASGDRMAMPERTAGLLGTRPEPEEIAPGEVHLLLLWMTAEAGGARPFWREEAEGGVVGLE